MTNHDEQEVERVAAIIREHMFPLECVTLMKPDIVRSQNAARSILSANSGAIAELRGELEHFIDIVDGTEKTGFDPHVEQMLMDAAETSRALLSKQEGRL